MSPEGWLTDVNFTWPTRDVTTDTCDVIVWQDDVTMTSLCVLSAIFGLIYCFLGYRCFRAVMFVSGLSTASTLVFVMCQKEASLSPAITTCLSLGVGLLGGLLSVTVQYVGVFITGLHLGLAVAGLGVVTVCQLPSPLTPPPLTPPLVALCLLVAALVAALVALKWPRAITILTCSVVGASVVLLSCDCVALDGQLVAWLVARLVAPCWPRGGEEDAWWNCWQWRLAGVTWLVVCTCGVCCQCCCFHHHHHHLHHHNIPASSTTPPRNNNNNEDDVTLDHATSRLVGDKSCLMVDVHNRAHVRQLRADLRQRKYRHIYHVRTRHGDVISQECIRSLSGGDRGVDRCGASAADTQSTLQSNCTCVTSVAAPVGACPGYQDESCHVHPV